MNKKPPFIVFLTNVESTEIILIHGHLIFIWNPTYVLISFRLCIRHCFSSFFTEIAIKTSYLLLVTFMEASNTPLSPATDSSLTAADTLLVLPPDKLLHTPELLSLIGLSGGFDTSMMSASCDLLALITLSFNDCPGEGLGCTKDPLWASNRDPAEGSPFMGSKFDWSAMILAPALYDNGGCWGML